MRRHTAWRALALVLLVAASFAPIVVAPGERPRAAANGGSATGGRPQPSLANAGYRTLLWSDEFAGPAGTAPSASRWVHDVGAYGWTGGELQTYTRRTSNAAVDGRGHLAITARRQTVTGPDDRTRHYTSARLTTRGLFSATHGRFEARMKIPSGRGLWPAFWMLGDAIESVGWPAGGEIDVMEALGQHPSTVYGTLHGPRGPASSAGGSSLHSPRSLAGVFHTYGVIWSPSAITWLLDGVPYASKRPAALAPGWRGVFNRPFHLLLNLAVGGRWPGPPDAATRLPARLLVDWVRVYR